MSIAPVDFFLSTRSPAKLNLFLAVLGQRNDSYHELISFIVHTQWGDLLSATWDAELNEDILVLDEKSSVSCPVNDSNSILKASRVFRSVCPIAGGFRFSLTKHIPLEAGLGGGSSNAASALFLLNQSTGNVLLNDQLSFLAASIGSDVPLFLSSKPAFIRGRGEVIEPVSLEVAECLKGQRIFIFKPAFGVSTQWAYSELKSSESYTPEKVAKVKAADFINHLMIKQPFFYNDFLKPISFKFPLIAALLESISSDLELPCCLSGSGSACYVFFKDDADLKRLNAIIDEALGINAFRIATELAHG